jgi:hypothetical protein
MLPSAKRTFRILNFEEKFIISSELNVFATQKKRMVYLLPHRHIGFVLLNERLENNFKHTIFQRHILIKQQRSKNTLKWLS